MLAPSIEVRNDARRIMVSGADGAAATLTRARTALRFPMFHPEGAANQRPASVSTATGHVQSLSLG